MRNRNRRWILFWFLISILQLTLSEEINIFSNLTDATSNDDPNRGVFSPRMDYEQWKPLGRGDPLKNDPTYDYVPPVLDRVHYWVDPAERKPDPPVPGENQKTEILLLGITSKKPAIGASADSRRDTYDPYVKYVPGSNYNSHNSHPNQRIARPSFIPSVPTSFFPSFFQPNKSKYSDRGPFSKGTEQRVPYTMLMPPPIDTRNSINPLPDAQSPLVTQTTTTVIEYTTPSSTTASSFTSDSTSSVTVQAANLVYHSSSLSDGSEWQTGKNKFATASPINWSSSTSKGTIPDYREELVYNPHLAPPESYMHIEFAPHNYTNKPLVAADSNHNINYVTPPPLIKSPNEEVMFKGQVTDDNLDITNTYVKIGKTEAEVHSTGVGVSNIPVKTVIRHPISMGSSDVVMFPHMAKPAMMPNVSLKPKMPPLTMQILEEMQTMHPPPVTQNPIFTKSTNAVFNILEKEKTRPFVFKDFTTVPHTSGHVVTSSSIITVPSSTTEKPVSSTTTSTSTTTTDPPATSTTSLTTDPIFKHYKQPAEPLKGPLYLIIQGHSKVKTYGPSKQINGILIQDSNEISDDKYEKSDFEVKHLHGFHKDTNTEEQPRRGRTGNLQTLKHVIQTGLGAIDFSGIDDVKKRSDTEIQEAELQMGYEVAGEKDATTEIYHKGIVEEARKLKL